MITEMFPSPRGVELHKPGTLLTLYISPTVIKFPSPRGVELHKPIYVPNARLTPEAVSVPSRG